MPAGRSSSGSKCRTKGPEAGLWLASHVSRVITMSKTRKILLTVLIVGITGTMAALGVFSAYSATTSNDNNSYQTGSVSITDNDAGAFLYQATNQAPGTSTVSCIKVTYTGSLASSVKLYLNGAVTNGGAFNLTVERGSGLTTFGSACTGFTPSSTPYNGTLGAFPTTYVAGIDGKAGGAAWNQNDVVDYRFTISPVDDPTANAHTSTMSSGSHSYVWEARNN